MESDLHSHRIRLFVPWECDLLNCNIIPVYLLYESIIFIYSHDVKLYHTVLSVT